MPDTPALSYKRRSDIELTRCSTVFDAASIGVGHSEPLGVPRMTGDVDNLSAAWRAAEDDLGIDVVAPYSLERPDSTRLVFPALVPRFGRPMGTVVDVFSAPVGNGEVAQSLETDGYFYSQINPDVYVPYDRDAFIEALVDWGWFDSEIDPPTWYSEAVSESA